MSIAGEPEARREWRRRAVAALAEPCFLPGQRAGALMFAAEAFERAGRLRLSRDHYRQSAELEAAHARQPDLGPRSAGVYGYSACWCYALAGCWAEATALAQELLAREDLDPYCREQLEEALLAASADLD